MTTPLASARPCRLQIVDLEPLESLLHLTFLSLFRNRVTSLTALSHLNALRALDVSQNAIATAQVAVSLSALMHTRAVGLPHAGLPHF